MPTKSPAKKSAPVSFAAKIKPLCTATDVAHMKPMGVKLHNYTWMSNSAGGHANANAVYGQVSTGHMPPGNPWPASWVKLFAKWMSDGYKP